MQMVPFADLPVNPPPLLFWPEPIKRAIANGDTVGTGMEMLRTGWGFRALPVDPDTKEPFGFITPHGFKNATTDPQEFQQMMALAVDAAVAIVPGSRFAVLDDDDGGSLDVNEFGVSGTFAERTRRGFHHWVQVPEGRRLRKSRLKGAVGDLITGIDSGYAVFSPSPNYSPIDIDAPILTPPNDSPLWDYASDLRSQARPALALQGEDFSEAERIIGRMRESTDFASGIAALLDGANDEWAEFFPTANDHSESGRDFQLALAASHFLRGRERREEIIYALLERHSRKAERHKNPTQYLESVTHSALKARDQKDNERISKLAALVPKGVLDGTFPLLPRKQGEIWSRVERILNGKLEVSWLRDELSADGWVRVPVTDIASAVGANRRTVTRTLKEMEERGVIERKPVPRHHDGGHRCDSLVRWAQEPEMAA